MEANKVDRRVKKTKKQLRIALTKLLLEKPIKDITVREISDIVDINRGTFYLHYKDVYDLLEQIERDIFEEFNAILNSKPIIIADKKPLPILNDIFRYFNENADMAIALIGPHGDHAFVSRLQNVVKEKCFHDIVKVYNTESTKNFDYFYDFIVYGCIGLFKCWLESGRKETPEEMAALAEKIIMTGIKVLI